MYLSHIEFIARRRGELQTSDRPDRIDKRHSQDLRWLKTIFRGKSDEGGPSKLLISKVHQISLYHFLPTDLSLPIKFVEDHHRLGRSLVRRQVGISQRRNRGRVPEKILNLDQTQTSLHYPAGECMA